MTYSEAKNQINDMYNESVITDIQYIDMITDVCVQYESGVDDFTAYMEGIYSAINSEINKAEKKYEKIKGNISNKLKEHDEKMVKQGKKTIGQQMEPAKKAITKGTSKINKYVFNPMFKGGAIVGTHIYSKFKKDMMTAKEKNAMANRVAGKAKGIAFGAVSVVAIGPIQTALNLMAAATITNPQDEIDREFANIAKSAAGLYDKFKAFIANKANEEKNEQRYVERIKKFEADTGKLALAMDNCTAKIARKENRLATESASDNTYDAVEFVYPYVISECAVTEKGTMILDHLFEKGQYDVVSELLLLDPVFGDE